MAIGGVSATCTVPLSVEPAAWNSMPTWGCDFPARWTHLPEIGASAAESIDPLETISADKTNKMDRANRSAFIVPSSARLSPAGRSQECYQSGSATPHKLCVKSREAKYGALQQNERPAQLL
jgi:hypothetical protein